jgi:hypothetical protein
VLRGGGEMKAIPPHPLHNSTLLSYHCSNVSSVDGVHSTTDAVVVWALQMLSGAATQGDGSNLFFKDVRDDEENFEDNNELRVRSHSRNQSIAST